MEALETLVTTAATNAVKAANTVAEADRPGAGTAPSANVNLKRYAPPTLGKAMKGLFSGWRESQSFEKDLTQAAAERFAFREIAGADDSDPLIETAGVAKSTRSIIWPKTREEFIDVLYAMGERKSAKDVDQIDRAIKAMAEGTGSAGGYLVPTQYLQDQFAYALVSTTAIRGVPGIRSMPVSSNVVALPRESTTAGASQAAEAGTLTAQDATLSQQSITVKKQYGYRRYSNELLNDANPAWLEFLANTLVRDVALQQDAQFLFGSGAGAQIQGLIGYTGVTVTAGLGYMGANGSTPSFDNAIDWVYQLRAVNAEPDFVIAHPRVLNSLAKVKDSTGNYLMSSGGGVNAPVLAGTGLNGAPAKATLLGYLPTWFSSQLSIAQTVGTSTDCTTLILGASHQVILLERQGIEIAYSEHVNFNTDESAARAIGRAAIAILQPAAVETVAGIRP